MCFAKTVRPPYSAHASPHTHAHHRTRTHRTRPCHLKRVGTHRLQVIYFLSDHVTGWAYTKHNDLQSFWLLFAIPSGVWLVFSLWTVIVEGGYLAKTLNRFPAGDRKQKHTKRK